MDRKIFPENPTKMCSFESSDQNCTFFLMFEALESSDQCSVYILMGLGIRLIEYL